VERKAKLIVFEGADNACIHEETCRVLRSVAGTGTLRYLLRLALAAQLDAVDEELLARNVARQVKMPIGSIRKVTPW
jgi:hypothetical protein